MDPFDSNEPLRFTQVLRANKMRQQRSSAQQNISIAEAIDQVCDKEAQLRQITRRNLDIKRNYELSNQGRLLDIQQLEPEATWVRRLRLSQSEQLRNLYADLARMARPIPNPPKLDQDRCLARVLKFCLFLSQQKSVSPKSLERAFAEFKDQFPQVIRNDEKRDDLIIVCRNIFAKREDIMAVAVQKDFLELQGYTYNDKTFDDLFLNKWRGFVPKSQAMEESSESTDEEAEEKKAAEAESNGWGEEFETELGSKPGVLPAQPSSEAPLDESDQEADAEPVVQEPAQELDLEMIEPSKINQFKYVIDRYMQSPEDGGPNLLNTIDGYASLLSVILSNKRAEEIQMELMDLVGDANFELCLQLIEKREIIQEQCRGIEEKLKVEKNAQSYQTVSQRDVNRPGIGVNVEFVQGGGGRKGRKPQKVNNQNQFQKQNITNYDLLEKLGFDRSLLAENKRLGLKERAMNDLNAYLIQHRQEIRDGTSTIIDPEAAKAQIYKDMVGLGKSEIRTEENDDWKYVEITPPPKPPLDKSNLVKISSLPKFAHEAFRSATHLNRIQTIVHPVAFKQSRNLLVAAPTGAGKTNIALLTILREVSLHLPEGAADNPASTSAWNMKDKQFKVIYIAPLKALASEIVDKFSSALGYLGIRVRELTGDMSMTKQEIQETHVIVSTPEKWDVITRKTDGMMNLVNCMIIDEIHLLNDERGLVLECLVSRALTTGFKQQKPIRLVGLSATLPNYLDVADFINADAAGTFCFDSSYRPTPLKCTFYGVKEMGNAQRGNNIMNEIIFDNLERILKMGKQIIIFNHQRAATYNTANELIEILKTRPGSASLFQCPDKQRVQREIGKSRNEQVKELFPHGFSVHHAGMLRRDRNMVEAMFHNGDIKVLCSTSTLAWGVNLPAYAVLIKGTKVYDSSAGAYKDVGVFDVQQIFGRAGRPQFDKEGEAIILTPFKQMDDYVKMMQNKQNIESHLDKGLDNCLNAEIASGTITTISEGVQWLKKSYYYQRMVKNPHGYAISMADLQMDPSGHMVLLKKITEVVEQLNRARLIRFNRETEQVYSTDMGRIASNYYINTETMSYFMSHLKANTRPEMVLDHLAHATEFKQLDARKEETAELNILVADCNLVQVSKHSANEAPTKVLMLFESYLRNWPLKTFSLISDMAYIVQNSARLLRALFEIALQRNYSNLMKTTLDWCNILDKRVLPNTHIMRQFTLNCHVGKLTNANAKVTRFGYIKDDIVYRLEQKQVSMEDLYAQDLRDAHRYIGPAYQDEMYKFVSYVPYLETEISAQPITRTILKVQMTITAQFNWNDRWNGKSEPFWIIVDNDQEVLHSEYFQLQKKDVRLPGQRPGGIKNDDSLTLTFFVPYQVPEGRSHIEESEYYTIELKSDRWYGLSFYQNIQLSEICVPDEDYPHTRLLPLRPISIQALGEPKFEELYRSKFSYFNPIQTQVFHTLYHTDSNVLIGAPTGSGKTIMSELAMLRVFKEQPTKKVIYIAPLKALAKERIIDWKCRLGGEVMRKSVLELTGDCTPDLLALKEADLLITTPEKWDGISRNWQHRSYVSDVALVVIDEIHLLGQDRGPVIEVIVSRMRYIAEQTGNNVRFCGLSTALANAKDVADWLGIHKLGLFNFKPSVRPVPIKVFFEGFPEKHYCPRMATMNKPSFKAIMTHARDHPTLVFVSSRRQTRLTALDLIALSAADQQEKIAQDGGDGFFDFKKPFLHMDTEEISMLSEYIKDENLRHTIQFGVGMHHAGLEESDRKLVEDLFVKKKIQVLVTTSTLAWGVNFPARLVVVKGTEFFDPKQKRYVDFPLTDLLQMIGRAGRPGFDDHGIACVMVSEEKKNFYKKFLYEPFPVESSLATQLTDHLNAEIASGTLANRQHCLDYLTWTYFFRRLTKNPSFYNLDGNSAEAINSYLRTLVNSTLLKLRDAGCVTLDFTEDNIASTHLGYLASFYYLSHITVSQLDRRLQAETSIDEIIDILSKAQEFAGLPVRHNEDVLNEALSHLVPIAVNKHDLESPHVKANLLLQAHFDRSPLPITDFYTDTKSVLDQSIRVLQGMIDIAAHKGHLQTTMNLVHTLQMVIQGQWLDQSPFLNVPHFDVAKIAKLARIGIHHMVQLVSKLDQLDKVFAQAGIVFYDQDEAREVRRALERVPTAQVRWTIVKVNELNEPLDGEELEEGGEAQFSISLKRTNKSNSQVVSISNFPKYKEASWFLIIANSITNQLLCMKRVAFKRSTQKNLVVLLPEDFQREKYLKVFLMCDSYIGLDQEYTIDLLKVNQIIRKKAAEGRQESNKTAASKNTAAAKQSGMVVVNAKPPAAAMSMINTGGDDQNDLDRTQAEDDTNSQAAAEMPMQFQLYSDLTSKVFGDENRQHMLIAADGEGRDRGSDSESSFEFDVTADDIYDLTFF